MPGTGASPGWEWLSQVKELNYIWGLFTNEGKMERENNRQIGAASAVMQTLF